MKDAQWRSDCVFYDAELNTLRHAFKQVYDIFKDIDKRAERRQTVQISKSFFDYYERKSDLKVIPQKYYDFRLDDVRICIYRYRGFYSVLVLGFLWDDRYLRPDNISNIAGNLYGVYDTWQECIPLFVEVCYAFFQKYLFDHSYQLLDSDIPF